MGKKHLTTKADITHLVVFVMGILVAFVYMLIFTPDHRHTEKHERRMNRSMKSQLDIGTNLIENKEHFLTESEWQAELKSWARKVRHDFVLDTEETDQPNP